MNVNQLTRPWTAHIVVRLAFMRGGAIRVGGTPLILCAQFQRTAVLALQFGTEHFAFRTRLQQHKQQQLWMK